MLDLMRMPFVKGLEIGGWCRDRTHAARRLTRFSGPGHYCSANHPKWSGWRELHPRPPPSEGGRLLLTIHPARLALAEGVPPSSPVLEAPRSMVELRERFRWLLRLDSHQHRP